MAGHQSVNTNMPPATASSLKDFKDLKLIGKGSFGRVFRAIRPSDNTEYAIKEVNIKVMPQREREDAVNEVRILASVQHQMVIRYFDAFIEQDKLYIVTELARGGDIGAKIKRHSARKELMSEEMIWGFFIQICQGLKNLHKANILHRDIKAQNIFLVTAREVKIGDLGVAKLTKCGMAHTQIGTPYYMSPEIWRNRPYNKKSDIWSLGCLLYELASLKHPFEARDEKSLAQKVLLGNYAPIPSQYSPELQAMVKMLLVVDPNRRPSIDDILSHPYTQARIADASVKASILDSPPPSARGLFVSTIRVPRQLSQLQSQLPASKYPSNKANVASNVTNQVGKNMGGNKRGIVAQSVDDVSIRRAVSELKAPISVRSSYDVNDKENHKDDISMAHNKGAKLPDISEQPRAAAANKLPYVPRHENDRAKRADRPMPARFVRINSY